MESLAIGTRIHKVAATKTSCALVHNGIVTNYAELKALLVMKGYAFESETDTEVIAKLTKYLYDSEISSGRGAPPFPQLMMQVAALCHGASAVVVKSRLYPGEIVAFKRGSPLIVAVKRPDDAAESSRLGQVGQTEADGPCEIFLASDSSAIAEHTRHVVFVEDDDIIHIVGSSIKFYNQARMAESKSMLPEQRQLHELEIQLENLSKGNYNHFMQKEIFEQPESLVNSMRGRVNFENHTISLGGFNLNKHVLRNARRLIFIACGTSLHSCLAVRPLFDELSRVPVCVENASDFLDRLPPVFRDDVCFFVSQSGETADVLRALEYCRDKSAVLAGFTNVVGSTISRMTNFGSHLNCGTEIGVASTKAYTSQIVVMSLVALMLSEDFVSLAKRRLDVIDGLHRLSSDVAECLRMTDQAIQRLALKWKDAKSVLVLGRGFQYATCLEAALKIKELTYVHTEGINCGELKHGPLALIDENMPVIVVATHDSLIDRSKSAIQQIRARNGRPVVLVSQKDDEIAALADEMIVVPQTLDCLQTIVNIVPLQLLAYHLAVVRGCNVDCPRNLAKSVTTQ